MTSVVQNTTPTTPFSNAPFNTLAGPTTALNVYEGSSFPRTVITTTTVTTNPPPLTKKRGWRKSSKMAGTTTVAPLAAAPIPATPMASTVPAVTAVSPGVVTTVVAGPGTVLLPTTTGVSYMPASSSYFWYPPSSSYYSSASYLGAGTGMPLAKEVVETTTTGPSLIQQPFKTGYIGQEAPISGSSYLQQQQTWSSPATTASSNLMQQQPLTSGASNLMNQQPLSEASNLGVGRATSNVMSGASQWGGQLESNVMGATQNLGGQSLQSGATNIPQSTFSAPPVGIGSR